MNKRLGKSRHGYEQSYTTSHEFLKKILALARDVLEAERRFDLADERDRAKEALTELFDEAKSRNTISLSSASSPTSTRS